MTRMVSDLDRRERHNISSAVDDEHGNVASSSGDNSGVIILLLKSSKMYDIFSISEIKHFDV